MHICSSGDALSPTIRHRDFDAILEDLKSDLVLEDYHWVSDLVQWAYADDYITWFYRVSYPIMTSDVLEIPPCSSNQEVQEARDDHT